ncbi:MAG TPA: Asp-tRNA(Asn)/Glu-tRNA(Gln) amidotransferase subunit GatA [Terriglobales bacterium]|nr:Asp-tRNA(Asn)/Glu-tRNA(Gln) amidotransferase subunit GatA [Terriglobales bacterium]
MPIPTPSVELIRTQIAERQTTATAVAEQYFAAIAADDATAEPLHAYLTLSRERALQQAARIDTLADRGDPLPPLAGLPVGIKDVLSTQGVRTTCASRVLENYVPAYDATAVARLETAGAVVLGKLNCDEFAMGSTTENSAYGVTRNPRDRSRVPGGSSGGSAAAVGGELCVAALGSDTGGSIRQPAAFCGVVGLLPTYGRVSRFGLAAFASSLDHVGPLAHSAKDCAYLLQAMAGHDPLDATSAMAPVTNYVGGLDASIRGLKIGVPREVFGAGLDPEVEARIRESIAVLRGAGCEIVDITLPSHDAAIAVYYVIATAEASSNLARYDGVRYGRRAPAGSLADMYRQTRDQGFGAEVKRRILLGTYVLSAGYYDAYYRKAQQVRALVAADYQRAFAEVDLICSPTTPTPAFKLGEKVNNPLELYLADVFTIPADLAGIPAISVPCGEAHGLPVGLQLTAPAFEEERLLRAAHHFEALRPPLLPASLAH